MIKLTCIVCPRGCQLEINDSKNVTGNFCIRGKKYALEEITNPQRILTSTMRINSKFRDVISVKTSGSIPKEKMFDVMKEINSKIVKVPCKIGDVIIKNVCGLNIDIIATCNILD